MAKNWTVAEATDEILAGNKEAVIDIGRRFPLATRAIAVAGESAKEILAAFNFITVRKVESILKDGVEVSNDEDDEIEDPVEKPVKKAKADEKPAKKTTAKKDEKPVKKVPAKKAAMNEPEEEDEEDYESMSEVDLFKVCKAKGLKPAPKQKKKYYLDLLKSENEEEDWDEEEDEKPAKKTTREAVAKKKAAKKAAAEDEDDDWDI